MYIDRIVLRDFKAYKGTNTLEFTIDANKNVSIISGNNGYGKTSLLTGLVWCLYGKLMGDVDERYRKEIADTAGGYKNYCQKLLNHISRKEANIFSEQAALTQLADQQLIKETNTFNSFEINIRFKKIFIPVIPCNDLEIKRQYDVKTHTETLKILIDGNENELTKQVGPEIFINDFVLRKEIAKFFFFDAEKIVELAEISTLEDKRNLSRAYGEVLGIKKYLDLKDNLENLRLRLRKRSSGADRDRLEILTKQYESNVRLIEFKELDLTEKENALNTKRITSDKYQEQLIREGSSLSLQEFKEFKQMREHLQEDYIKLKNRMKDMMELVPMAIAASKMELIQKQLEAEQAEKDRKTNNGILKRKAKSLKKAITTSGIQLSGQRRQQLFNIIEDTLLGESDTNTQNMLQFTEEQQNHFYSVYDNLQNTFNKNFKNLTAEIKKQQTSLSIINRKLADAESKETDPVIKAIRSNKNHVDAEIKDLQSECIIIRGDIIALENMQKNISAQLSELKKKITLEDNDRLKDEIAVRLISRLDTFIIKLKLNKKQSLEQKIQRELQALMHKQNFIARVQVIIEGELIDIELYDDAERFIDKSYLSKGEQQLYATALLKALIEQSHIRFPVFIDSPLQKFDKEHAKNIIQDFYPKVSSQVILFPLLEKELNEAEFKLLYPNITECYLIKHDSKYESTFEKINPENLFSIYQMQ